MRLHLRPVGPLPASTYWRRRAAVLLLVVALLVLGGTALGAATTPRASAPAAPARTAAPAAPASSPVPPPPAAATPAPAAAAAPACRLDGLRLRARAARAQVGPGRPLGLRLTVRNAGPACRLLLPDRVRLRVVSGPDPIWSSDHCAALRRVQSQVLQRGSAVAVETRWNGRRSRPRCAGPFEPSRPGVYRVLAEVGDVRVRGGEFVVRR